MRKLNNQRKKFLKALKFWKRVVLAWLACLIFANGQILASQSVTVREPAAAAVKLTIEGKQLYERGQFDSAAKVWQEAAKIYEQSGDEQHKNQSLINVAEALQADGLNLKACSVVIQAFQIDRFNCRALIENDNSDRAFNSWFKTIQVQSATAIQANGLNSFGDILQKLGRLDLSNRVLEKSLQIARRLSSSSTEGAILLSLGNNQQLLGDRIQTPNQNPLQGNNLPLTCEVQTNVDAVPMYQQAILLYQQAASKFSSPHPWIKIQLNRLRLLVKIGAKPQAIALLRQILAKLPELSPESNSIYTRINLAKSLICLQQNFAITTPSSSEIADILTTAVKQAQNLEDRRGESYALGYLGWLYQREGQIARARSFLQKALFLAQTIHAKDIAYKWQWQLGYLLETQGDLPGAIAAYSNAVELHQLLRNDIIAAETKTQFYFQEQAEPVYRKLVELLLQTQDIPAQQQNNLQLARKTIESLRLVELENYLQQACLEPKVAIDKIVDRADSTAAVIYPIVLEQQLAIVLKLPRQAKLRYYTTAISQEKLIDTTTKLESYLPDVTRTSQVNRLSQQIYEWLITPLENDLRNSQIETLVFVPDSYFRNIPMSVLYDRRQQQYLIEKYAIAVAPSLQLVDSKPSGNFSLEVLTAGISQKRLIEGQEFSPLINVQQELSQIRSQASNSEELLNRQFTTTNLQQQIADNSFSVIHLATHSQFSSNLDQTFILVWERLLKIEDLVNLFQINNYQDVNPIQLLVLSACQTAKGDRLAALGLAGITVRAGVNATLATLWSVDDLSTTQIMDRFYQELNQDVTNAKAIQKAQLAFLNRDRRPYFWAPFILVGNWL